MGMDKLSLRVSLERRIESSCRDLTVHKVEWLLRKLNHLWLLNDEAAFS